MQTGEHHREQSTPGLFFMPPPAIDHWTAGPGRFHFRALAPRAKTMGLKRVAPTAGMLVLEPQENSYRFRNRPEQPGRQ